MNYSTAILITNDSVRCIKAIYDEGAPKEMFKTFDKSIEVDSLIIVPSTTRHNYTVCKVVAVDVDDWMNVSREIPWVVAKIDLEQYAKIKEFEDSAIVQFKSAEKLRQRRELKASMEAALAENKDAIRLLSSSPFDVTPLENKTE